MDHPCLDDVVGPLKELREKVRNKALMRLKYEGKQSAGPLVDRTSKWFQRPKDYAEDIYAYYECFKCKVRPGACVACAGVRACGSALARHPHSAPRPASPGAATVLRRAACVRRRG